MKYTSGAMRALSLPAQSHWINIGSHERGSLVKSEIIMEILLPIRNSVDQQQQGGVRSVHSLITPKLIKLICDVN